MLSEKNLQTLKATNFKRQYPKKYNMAEFKFSAKTEVKQLMWK